MGTAVVQAAREGALPRPPATELEPNLNAGSITVRQFDVGVDAVTIISAGPAYTGKLLGIFSAAGLNLVRVTNLGTLDVFTQLRMLDQAGAIQGLWNSGEASIEMIAKTEADTPALGYTKLQSRTGTDGISTAYLIDDAGAEYNLKDIATAAADLAATRSFMANILMEIRQLSENLGVPA